MLWILRCLPELLFTAILNKVLPALAGTLSGRLVNGWRRRRYVRRLLPGDASETIVVEQVLVTANRGQRRTLRTRQERLQFFRDPRGCYLIGQSIRM